MKVSSYGPFVSGAESCVTMQVGAMPVQMLRATALQAGWCAVRSEQCEQQTTVHILPAVHRENDEADEVVSAVRRCPVVAARTSRRRGGDWALDALSRFAALPRSSIFHAAKPSCSARTSRIPRSHVRATPSRLFSPTLRFLLYHLPSRLSRPAFTMVAWKLSSLLLPLCALNAFAAIDVSSPRCAET